MRALGAFFITATVVYATGAADLNWPQFRGPNGLSAAEGNPPVEFSAEKNLLWKIDMPDGNSSPVIWGDKIFLTGFASNRLETICLDKATGKTLWHQPAPAQKIEAYHPTGSAASPTPATDGERVYVYFGSFGLLAYDFNGGLTWKLELPPPVVEFGASSSPIVADGKVILLCDQDLGSFMVALNPANGKEVWKIDRSEFRRGFATPLVWHHADGIELVTPGSIWLKSYSLKDGSELWSYEGTSRVACSSPAASPTRLFSASWNVGGDPSDRITMPAWEQFAPEHDVDKNELLSKEEIPAGPVRERFPQIDLNKNGQVTREEWENMRAMFAKAGNAVLGISPGGRGNITATHLAWKSTRSLPYVSSPLYYKERVYTVKNGGLASCYNAQTGDPFYQDERIGALGDYYSSAVAANDHIYIASQNGIVVTHQAGDAFQPLARNNLEEQIFATPAISGNVIYIRTRKHLFAFGSTPRS